jgi:hypothetical protein
VFADGERVEAVAALAETAHIDVVGAVSGGGGAQVLVGSRKGLFVLRGERGGPMDVAARAFAGAAVEYAMRDPRTGRFFASVTHGQFGPRLYVADDPAGDWEQLDGPRFADGDDASVERIWIVTPGEADGLLYAGVDPATLFESRDGGRTWELNRALWEFPGKDGWTPGAGGLMVHSICPWPGDPDRLAIGASAVGVFVTEDAGRSWRLGNEGLVPRYLPERRGRSRSADASTTCIARR